MTQCDGMMYLFIYESYDFDEQPDSMSTVYDSMTGSEFQES